ncbi:MAG: glycosyltransferase family 2 protein, partial [Pseudomonadota bacterium]
MSEVFRDRKIREICALVATWFRAPPAAMAKIPPFVSVVIPVFNKAPFIRECLQSVSGQSLASIEVICVDDCSTDESASIVLDYANTDSRVLLLRMKANGGPGAARNLGMSRATGRFIFFLDADDLLPENALQILYELAVASNSDL